MSDLRRSDAMLLDAANLLMETNQRGLPVIDGEGELVGVITEGDFLHRTELDISPPPGNWLEKWAQYRRGYPRSPAHECPPGS